MAVHLIQLSDMGAKAESSFTLSLEVIKAAQPDQTSDILDALLKTAGGKKILEDLGSLVQSYCEEHGVSIENITTQGIQLFLRFTGSS